MTIEVEDDAQPDVDVSLANQTIIDIHRISVKDKINQTVSELLYLAFTRNIMILSFCVSSVILSTQDSWNMIALSIVIAEGTNIILITVLSKFKWKSIPSRSNDIVSALESALIVLACYSTHYKKYQLVVFLSYLSMVLIRWKICLSQLIDAIDETFVIKLVFFY